MLMIWSNRARNRSFDPVVLCFFGRIVPSDAPQNHGPKPKGIQNEIARFCGLKLPIPAISNASRSEKQTPAQSLRALFTDDLLRWTDRFRTIPRRDVETSAQCRPRCRSLTRDQNG